MPKGQSLAVRLWSKVDKSGPVPSHCPERGPCWVWVSPSRAGGGYGKIKVDGRDELAHRASFFLEHGRWPDPCALHHCDNRLCVRPSHLFEGTKVDNNADRDAKGRTARGARHWSNLRPEQRLRAERHGMVKLTDQQTEQIRARFAAGAITQQALADEYGVWQTTISYIVRRTKRRA